MRLLLAFVAIALAGCTSITPITSREEFDSLTCGDGLFYVGSAGATNYFHEVSFRRETLYSCAQSVYPINNTFPRTDDRTQWKVFVRDFENHKGGFQGVGMQSWNPWPWTQEAEQKPAP
jgi:hypothetical protein